MKRIYKLSILLLLVTKNIVAQDSKLQLNVYPLVGIHTSIPILYAKSNYSQQSILSSLLPSKTLMIGLGLQANILEDWTASLEYAHIYMGGGLKWFYQDRNGGHVYTGKEYTFTSTYMGSLNTEKAIWNSETFKKKGKYHFFRFSGLLGTSIMWIPLLSSDEVISCSSVTHGSNNIIRSKSELIALGDITGTINAGVTIQWFKHFNPNLKLSIVYGYGLKPLYEFRSTNVFLNQYQEEIAFHSGKHNLSVSLQYPFVLYRNKAQKEYISQKQKHGY